jgi:hypothetical protein
LTAAKEVQTDSAVAEDEKRCSGMIKIENPDMYGLEAAIRGMRNPLNSWEKSDSYYGCENTRCEDCEYSNECAKQYRARLYSIGENDLALAQRLIKAGSDHSKFMRMITVTCDITAPLYWWKEYDTYKVGTVANSCSTMHKIHAKEFTLDDFSIEHLHSDYECECGYNPMELFRHTLDILNHYRVRFLKAKMGHTQFDAVDAKDFWWQMIQLLPSSFNQRRTVQLNYAVLRNMYHARNQHKLDEWVDFCGFIENLPYAKELIVNDN